jgi:hypothetical protein
LCQIQVPLFDFLPPRGILMVHEGTEKGAIPCRRVRGFCAASIRHEQRRGERSTFSTRRKITTCLAMSTPPPVIGLA